jgi:hypothetical protein
VVQRAVGHHIHHQHQHHHKLSSIQ